MLALAPVLGLSFVLALPAAAPTADPAPAGGERIVALDESAALNLLTLGIEPAITLTSLSSDLFTPIAEALGLETADYSVAAPSMEYLATLQPDRIVALANPFVTSRLADYEAIAPTTVIPVDGAWPEQVGALGAELGREEAAAEIVATVEADLAAVAADLDAAGRAGTSVSVITARGEMVIAATGAGPAGQVLSALGLTRPAAQDAGGEGLPFVPVSLETLADHDADVLALATGSLFDPAPIRESALYPTLSAVTAGSAYEVVAEPWIVGGSAFAAWWVGRDVAQVLLDGAAPATPADAAARWGEFTTTPG